MSILLFDFVNFPYLEITLATTLYEKESGFVRLQHIIYQIIRIAFRFKPSTLTISIKTHGGW